jgi:acyl-CoA hydrolase
MIDVVITEHGCAHIRDKPVEQRAQALIGIAAPEYRPALQDAWEKIRGAI